MMYAIKSCSIDKVRLGTFLAAVLVFPALAQTDDENTRGVRILEQPLAAPAQSPLPETPAPGLVPLVPPSGPSPPVSAPPAPAAASTSTAVPDAANYNVISAPSKPADLGTPSQPIDFAALQSSVKVANSAAVSVDIIPGPDLTVGARVSFRISTKKAGYLVLVDVDATGKLTQIYPNPISLMARSDGPQNANYLKPGKPVQIPNPADPYAGFEFVAAAPFGTAMVVAILSDRPVQLVDLPDIPDSLTGQASAVAFLTKLAGDLRIPEGDSGRLQEARWSFDAKFYAIR